MLGSTWCPHVHLHIMLMSYVQSKSRIQACPGFRGVRMGRMGMSLGHVPDENSFVVVPSHTPLLRRAHVTAGLPPVCILAHVHQGQQGKQQALQDDQGAAMTLDWRRLLEATRSVTRRVGSLPGGETCPGCRNASSTTSPTAKGTAHEGFMSLQMTFS